MRLNAAGLTRVSAGTVEDLGLPGLPERTFRIFERGGDIVFTGDRPRSVLAGALYYLHHLDRGTPETLPLKRTSPYRERLVLEDFPFHCYQPTGFDFDPVLYAENLVALGYTAMECNRFSRRELVGEYFEGYQFTNPSPARFVWTRWHEGVWDRDVIGANAAELRACIEIAESFDLEPSFTAFLPRPYPESFFRMHPHLRGSYFRHEHLIRGGHEGFHRIDTDHEEGMEFYRTVYDGLLEENAGLRHFFFWHADLGTGFWKDGEGPSGRSEADRIIEFHEMLEGLFLRHNIPAQVWVNPWAMKEESLPAMNARLPTRVGYAVKDNTDAAHFFGTTPSRLPDLTIISPTIGGLFHKVEKLAAEKNRRVCLCQYQDFSEDLDPVLGVPHPMLSFRKFRALSEAAPDCSSTNWGVISPEKNRCTVNQDVIREMVWRAEEVLCIEELVPRLIPGGDAFRQQIATAWRKADIALQIWPQYWGLRLQDGGLRYRWLVKPLLLGDGIAHGEREYYLARQGYRIDSATPFKDFLDLENCQAREIAGWYAEMVELLGGAIAGIERAKRGATAGEAAWAERQLPPLRWCRRFFLTYRHLLAFHSLPASGGMTPEHETILCAEIANTREILVALATAERDSLVIARRGAWSQCFGPDIADDFDAKLKLLERSLTVAK
ncbi:MAG: hypothetical protein J0I10_19085 [Verrucomicrobia bacterium]|nr:hypothetical protein [Verrucomicrobiota bacterium]